MLSNVINRLPTKGDTLRYFFFLKQGPFSYEKYSTTNNSLFEKVVDEVIDVRTKTGFLYKEKIK